MPIDPNGFTWGEPTWGSNGWSGVESDTAELTGVSSTASLGTTSNIEGVGYGTLILTGWGRTEWSESSWGTDNTTTAVVGSVGSVTTRTTNVFGVTGVEATSVAGTLDSFVCEANVVPNGSQLAVALGDDGTIADAVVTPSGVSASANPGASWGDDAWGASLWGGNTAFRIGQIINVDRGSLVAVEATGAVGTVVNICEANVSLTGVSTTAALGNEETQANSDVPVTGLSATADLGASDEEVTADAVVIEDGTSATGAIGSSTVVAKADVLPTGVSSTASLGDNADDEAIGDAVVVETGFGITATLAARSKITTVSTAVVLPTGVVGTTNSPKVTMWGGGEGLPGPYDPDFWTTAAA